MSPTPLSPAEQDQVRNAMNYWVMHWDLECPTLFGIELEDLQAVVQTWPHAGLQHETEALATIGSLRELLYGASTLPRNQLTAILGLEYDAASTLCEKVYALYRKERLSSNECLLCAASFTQHLSCQEGDIEVLPEMTPNPSIERTSPGKPGLASHVKR